jgi:lipid-binding SYLF domain-containing protein
MGIMRRRRNVVAFARGKILARNGIIKYPTEERRRHMNHKKINFRAAGVVILALTFIAISIQPVIAADPAAQQGTVDKALVTYRSFMADKDMQWFRNNLKDVKALLIVPNLLKAGFILGGSGGSGVLVARDAKTAKWSQPAFYTVGSVTFGLQIGGEAAEVIMMLRTQKAMDALYTTEFKLGGDASVAAGPVGTGAQSAVTADVVSFAKAKGLFAGLNLEGSIIKVSADSNKAYYGKPVSPLDIIMKNAAKNEGSAKLLEELNKPVK